MTEHERIARDAVALLENLPLNHTHAAQVRVLRDALIAASRK